MPLSRPTSLPAGVVTVRCARRDGSGGKCCRRSVPHGYFFSVKAVVAVTFAWPTRVSVALPVIFRLFAFFSSLRADAVSLTVIVAFPAFEYDRLPVARRI